MADAYIGEIRMFAGNFAPRGWALCDGQLLQIADNSALFSLFGTTYGGDGQTTFGLPDLRGRLAIHAGSGTGPGLSPRTWGSKGGSENATVSTAQVPAHTHTARGTADAADADIPNSGLWGQAASEHYADAGTLQPMAAGVVQNTGGNQSHDNVMPFQCVNFIVALIGTFPSRN